MANSIRKNYITTIFFFYCMGNQIFDNCFDYLQQDYSRASLEIKDQGKFHALTARNGCVSQNKIRSEHYLK